MSVQRDHWLEHVDEIIRSRHYTWLPQGLGGEPVDEAMSWLVTDIMHICKRSGVDWEDILQRGQARFQKEEINLLAEISVPQS
tara:strand:- start:103559 stop:103807 length:249 start_codon:yes stop_codon:yes gene_type:complete